MFPPVSAQEHYVFELTESTFERINKWASSLHVPDDLSEHKLIRKQDSRESAHTPFFVFPVTALYAEPCKSTVKHFLATYSFQEHPFLRFPCRRVEASTHTEPVFVSPRK